MNKPRSQVVKYNPAGRAYLTHYKNYIFLDEVIRDESLSEANLLFLANQYGCGINDITVGHKAISNSSGYTVTTYYDSTDGDVKGIVELVSQSIEGTLADREKLQKAVWATKQLKPFLVSLEQNIVDVQYSVNAKVKELDYYFQCDAYGGCSSNQPEDIVTGEWLIITYKGGYQKGINVGCCSLVAMAKEALRFL